MGLYIVAVRLARGRRRPAASPLQRSDVRRWRFFALTVVALIVVALIVVALIVVALTMSALTMSALIM